MTFHDTVNAIFEGGGAIFLCLNVRRLLKDRSVKGVSLWTSGFWTAWGFWNVYFYSAVQTPASFYAGIAVVLVNAVWLGLAVHYARQAKRAATVPLGYYGLPVCDCDHCKPVFPPGNNIEHGWCGHCGKDLIVVEAAQ